MQGKSKDIIELVKQKIDSGELISGQAMPSLRAFANQYKVSFKTAVRIYDKLADSAYIVKRHGKGSYVKAVVDGVSERAVPKKLVSSAPRSRFIQNIKNDDGAYKYHFIDTHQRHYMVPYDFINDLQEDIERNLLSDYASPYGDQELRSTLVSQLRMDHIETCEDQLMIVSGVQQGINLIVRSFVDRGDSIAISELSFPAAADVLNWQKARICSIPILSDGIDLDVLYSVCEKEDIKFLYTMPNYNNPTGLAMSLEKKYELLSMAETFGFYIIEDDSWSDLYLGNEKSLSLKALDSNGRVIYLKGLTKTLGAGYRVGVIVADETIIDELVNGKVLSDLGTPIMTQRAVVSVLNSQTYCRQLEQIRQDIKKRMALSIKILDAELPDGVRYIKPDGGPNIWIELPQAYTAADLLLHARKRCVNFGLGHVYYTSDIKQNTLRLSIANLKYDLLEEGLRQFCEAVNDMLLY